MGEPKVRITKNQTVRLTKVVNELRRVMAGMGWSPGESGHSWDLDQSIIVMDKYGRFVKQISFHNKEHSNEFWYHGDDLTGGSGGRNNDDEQIDINFSKLDSTYDRLIVIMNIYRAYEKNQDLSMVKDAYIHLVDVETKKELVEYSIESCSKFEDKTGMFVGEFYKKNGDWEFLAIGEPVRVKNIQDMIDIIKDKYSNIITAEQSWEKFLFDSGFQCPPTPKRYDTSSNNHDTNSRPKKSFWSKLFG